MAPGGAALRYAQDKLAMRDELTRLGAPCPRYAPVASAGDVAAFAAGTGWPVVLKAVRGGYDGRGVWVCDGPDQAAEVLGYGVALLAEEHVPFVRELAALVARSPHRQGAAYPVVQTVQRDGVCREVLAPAPGLSAGARRGRAAAGPGTRGRARGDRPAGRGAVRDPARPAGERAGHAAAQQRALDHRGRHDLPVRAASAGRAGPAARRAAARSRRRWSWPTCSGPPTWPERARTCTTATST